MKKIDSSWVFRAGCLLALGLLGGCATTDPAPDISNQIPPGSLPAGSSAADLSSGRTIYTLRCVSCHALPAVSEHSASAWPAIVEKMGPRSRLSENEKRQVVLYVTTASKLAGSATR